MEIKILNNEERRTCHNLFRKNDLFRHWHPILSEVERGITEMDAISVWYNAEMILRELRACIDFRDDEINFIHAELDKIGKKECVTAIMAVVLTRLMNATEVGHEEESIPNDTICNAILKKHIEDEFFGKLMNVFFNRNIGNDNKKVVITPSDPMTQNTTLDDMDDVAKNEISTYLERVMALTKGLNGYLKNDWERWQELWKSICTDADLFNLLKEINPNKNEWGLNQKMICNVVGICHSEQIFKTTISALSNALSPTKRLNSYISNFRNFGGSDSALSKERYNKVVSLLRSVF